MMNQLYEDKCDCKPYSKLSDHCSSLIKMDLPDYKEGQYGETKFAVFRVARLVGCIVVVALLGYSLWRIQVLESGIRMYARKVDRMSCRDITLDNVNKTHSRARRAVDASDLNTLTDSTVDQGSSSDESIATTTRKPSHIQRPRKENYDKLIDELFDKMYVMKVDTDRRHLRNNIRAVFEAWSAVFDAAVPYETVNEAARRRRSVKDKSSEESSEEQKKQGTTQRPKRTTVRDENNKQSSEESSEEKKRNKRSVDRSGEEPCESSEEDKQGLKCKESSRREESSGEHGVKQKEEHSSNESKERSESQESLEKKEDDH